MSTESSTNEEQWQQQLIGHVRRSTRRHKNPGKHTRVSRTSAGKTFEWHETKQLPEDIKAKNRNRNKAKRKQQRKVRRK